MKTRKGTETYVITEADETGEIPAGVGSVIITYHGEAPSLFYNPRYQVRGNSEEELRDSSAELASISTRLNRQTPSTPEGVEKIVQRLRASQE